MRTIFDSHLHIIDPRFPLIENQGYVPAPFTCEDYRHRVAPLQVKGGAVVSGSFQGFDQTYLLDSLQNLGPGFVGVTQLPHDTSDQEIMRLHDGGVRAIRFNVRRGGSEDISRLDYFAQRVYELAGWHAELYIDSAALASITAVLENLPKVSIDHLGLSEEGLPMLLSLADKGVRVKATGFGRVELDVAKAIRSIYGVNPDALMFGTDLPSTKAKRPYDHADMELICDILDEEQAAKVLYQNAMDWYLG